MQPVHRHQCLPGLTGEQVGEYPELTGLGQYDRAILIIVETFLEYASAEIMGLTQGHLLDGLVECLACPSEAKL